MACIAQQSPEQLRRENEEMRCQLRAVLNELLQLKQFELQHLERQYVQLAQAPGKSTACTAAEHAAPGHARQLLPSPQLVKQGFVAFRAQRTDQSSSEAGANNDRTFDEMQEAQQQKLHPRFSLPSSLAAWHPGKSDPVPYQVVIDRHPYHANIKELPKSGSFSHEQPSVPIYTLTSTFALGGSNGREDAAQPQQGQYSPPKLLDWHPGDAEPAPYQVVVDKHPLPASEYKSVVLAGRACKQDSVACCTGKGVLGGLPAVLLHADAADPIAPKVCVWDRLEGGRSRWSVAEQQAVHGMHQAAHSSSSAPGTQSDSDMDCEDNDERYVPWQNDDDMDCTEDRGRIVPWHATSLAGAHCSAANPWHHHQQLTLDINSSPPSPPAVASADNCGNVQKSPRRPISAATPAAISSPAAVKSPSAVQVNTPPPSSSKQRRCLSSKKSRLGSHSGEAGSGGAQPDESAKKLLFGSCSPRSFITSGPGSTTPMMFGAESEGTLKKSAVKRRRSKAKRHAAGVGFAPELTPQAVNHIPDAAADEVMVAKGLAGSSSSHPGKHVTSTSAALKAPASAPIPATEKGAVQLHVKAVKASTVSHHQVTSSGTAVSKPSAGSSQVVPQTLTPSSVNSKASERRRKSSRVFPEVQRQQQGLSGEAVDTPELVKADMPTPSSKPGTTAGTGAAVVTDAGTDVIGRGAGCTVSGVLQLERKKRVRQRSAGKQKTLAHRAVHVQSLASSPGERQGTTAPRICVWDRLEGGRGMWSP